MTPPSAALSAELLDLAVTAARAAGTVARERHGRLRDVRLKADHSEVSEADEAAQDAAIQAIQTHRPQDGFIAEERTPLLAHQRPPTADRPCWVIDPIDGTRNYLRGLPDYCASVGVLLDGVAVAGAIYAPIGDRLYAAQAAGPLLVDGAPVPPIASESDQLLVAIPSTATGAVHGLVHDWLDRLVVRNIGATALHLALVATGQFDAAVNANPKLWDIAAGAALLTAAGGTLDTPGGQPRLPIDVATYAGGELPCVAATPRARTRLSRS